MGDLTPIGERQHYLLGTQQRIRYQEELGLFPKFFDPEQVFIGTTSRDRTQMSAYAEILGIYPLLSGHTLDAEEQRIALPPFTVKKDPELNHHALPLGF